MWTMIDDGFYIFVICDKEREPPPFTFLSLHQHYISQAADGKELGGPWTARRQEAIDCSGTIYC